MEVSSDDGKVGQKLAPFNPSHDEVVEVALRLMDLKDSDVLYDLGCGDGRVMIKACQQFPTLRAIGIEYDANVYQRALNLVNEFTLGDRIHVVHDNVLNVDFEDATAIFVYLLPDGMKKLREKFCAALEKGTRIVSYVFSIPGVEPAVVEIYKSSTKIYLYRKQ